MIIRQFKLLNGDDIIAVLQTKNVDNYIIERPVQIIDTLLGQLTFNHWFPLSSQKIFKLYKNRCIQHVPIDADVEHAYTQYILNTKENKQYNFGDNKDLANTLLEKTKEYNRMMEEITDDDYNPPFDPDESDPTIH